MSKSSSLSPVPLDLFSRFMVDMYDEKEIISVPTAFQTFFGNPAGGGKTVFEMDANSVDIDIIRGNERTAKMKLRGTNSIELGSVRKDTTAEQFSSFSRKYPLVVEKGNIESDQLIFRSPGESPFARNTRLERMRRLALRHHHEHIRRITRLFEILARDSILTGKHAAILGTTNTDLIYDFNRAAGNIITVGTAWNGVTPDIMGDLDDGLDQLRAKGHVKGSMAVFGDDAMDAFIKDETVQKLADNRRFELIQVNQNNPVPPEFSSFIEAGFTPRGRLMTPKGYDIWVFTYNDVFTNDAGSPEKYMPGDKVLLTNVKVRCDRYFGPPEILPLVEQRIQLYAELFGFDLNTPPMPPNVKNQGAAINPAMFHSDAFVSSDWTRLTLRTQAAPIFATTQTDSFVTLQGLIT